MQFDLYNGCDMFTGRPLVQWLGWVTGRTSGSLKTCASYPQSCCCVTSGRRKQRGMG